MHCIHYIRHLRQEEGGVVRAVLDLTRTLADHGTEVTIVTGGEHAERLSHTSDCGPLRILSAQLPPASLRAKFTPASRSELAELLRSADLLHLHTLWDPVNLPFARLASEVDRPYVVSTHGMLDDWAMRFKPFKKQLYLKLAGRRFLRAAFRLHCTAEGESRQVLARVPEASTFVAPLCVNLEEFRTLDDGQLARREFPALRAPGAKVLLLSRLHPIKGVELLIDAMAGIPPQIAPHLVIAGPGDPAYVADIERRLAQRGLTERTLLVGMVNGELKRSLYQACDLFVLPSQQENFGIVFAESLACGTPIITTDQVDAATELEAVGGIVVPRTVAALRDAITRALSAGEALAQRGARGRQQVFEWLDPKRLVERYQEFYHEAAVSKALNED